MGQQRKLDGVATKDHLTHDTTTMSNDVRPNT